MSTQSNAEEPLFVVIANSEDEFAIWPVAGRALPTWRRVSPIGRRTDCAAYIGAIESERRPAALRALLECGAIKC
jgi:uncharacterized protein YbdZ (MbtH family)